MKIGLLLPSVYMGSKYKNKIFAPKQLFLNLADGLVVKGHTVYVYSAPGTKTKAHLVEGKSELVENDFITSKFRGFDRVEKQKAAHLITITEYEMDLCVKAYLHGRENRIDIMHSYHGDTFMAHYINRIIDLQTVNTIHDPIPLREYLEHWRFNHFKKDNYIFISESQLNKFNGMVHSVGVVYHGVDVNKFNFEKKGGEYIAFLGRYIREKGVTEAIYAAKKTGKTLKMVGDDAYRVLPYYQKNILPYLEKGVIEDKSFGESDRDEFLKNARVLLFPILWDEPFGMVMIEAMSSGTPVIAFNRGSVSEVIKDGITGFIIEPDNENKTNKWIIKKAGKEGLIEAINRIYRMSEEEYMKMRVSARKHIEENFTVEKMVDGYERIYNQLINK